MAHDQLTALDGPVLEDTVNLSEVLPQQQQQQQQRTAAGQSPFALVQPPHYNFDAATSSFLAPDAVAVNLRRSKSDGGPRPGHTRLSRSEDMTHSNAMMYPPSSQQEFINRHYLYPQEPLPPIRGHSRRASSGSRGASGAADGSWSGLSSNRASPYPSPSASPRVRYDDLPSIPLTGRSASLLRPDPAQDMMGNVVATNNGGPVMKQTVTSERTAGASHRRRKQEANFLCPVPGCGSTFTRSFNLKGEDCGGVGGARALTMLAGCRAHAIAQRGAAIPVQVARVRQRVRTTTRLQAPRAAALQLSPVHLRGLPQDVCTHGRAEPTP